MSQLILVTKSFREFLERIDYLQMASEHGVRYTQGYQQGMQDIAVLLEMVGNAAYGHLILEEETDENTE